MLHGTVYVIVWDAMFALICGDGQERAAAYDTADLEDINVSIRAVTSDIGRIREAYVEDYCLQVWGRHARATFDAMR